MVESAIRWRPCDGQRFSRMADKQQPVMFPNGSQPTARDGFEWQSSSGQRRSRMAAKQWQGALPHDGQAATRDAPEWRPCTGQGRPEWRTSHRLSKMPARHQPERFRMAAKQWPVMLPNGGQTAAMHASEWRRSDKKSYCI